MSFKRFLTPDLRPPCITLRNNKWLGFSHLSNFFKCANEVLRPAAELRTENSFARSVEFVLFIFIYFFISYNLFIFVNFVFIDYVFRHIRLGGIWYNVMPASDRV